jgi:outer membrane protein OmpA-like peptidoglycan-associated protein
MLSRIILVIAIVFSVVWPILDVHYHGHWSDARFRAKVERIVKDGDFAIEPSDITINVADRWVDLKGIVKTKEDGEALVKAVTYIPGVRGVSDYLIGEVNVPALEKLKLNLAHHPLVAKFGYVVDNDKVVTLTGRVATQQLKDEIGELVGKIHGVRKVVNNLNVGPPKEQIEETIVHILSLQNIYFNFNSARIREESFPSLDKIANVLKEYPEIRVTIEGNTDNIGTVRYNQKLSEARASSVKNALVERGIDPSRLKTIGFGESRPIASNSTPEGRADNRRIEFKVQ